MCEYHPLLIINHFFVDIFITIDNDGNICVDVSAESCNPVFAIPIPINIPVGTKTVKVDIKIDVFNGCASVDVGAPKC